MDHIISFVCFDVCVQIIINTLFFQALQGAERQSRCCMEGETPCRYLKLGPRNWGGVGTGVLIELRVEQCLNYIRWQG